MATAAVIGLSTGKRFLSSSICPSDFTEKLYPISDHISLPFSASFTIVANKSSHFGANTPPTGHIRAIKALKEHAHTLAPSTSDAWYQRPVLESSLEALLLLQKSILEKQWQLPFTDMTTTAAPEKNRQAPEIVRSGTSARERRMISRKKCLSQMAPMVPACEAEQLHPSVSPELIKSDKRGYVRGIFSENLLTHSEVVNLSRKIEVGIHLEEHRTK